MSISPTPPSLLPDSGRPASSMQFLDWDAIMQIPSSKHLLSPFIVENTITVVYGAPASGKTFWILEMAFQMAMDFPVLYISAEGRNGLKKRLLALEQHHGRQPEHFSAHTQQFSLLDSQQISDLKAGILQRGIRVIIIDTLAQSMIGGDENSAKDMGQAVDAVRELRDMGITVILVHHSNKNSQTIERGSSSLRGAVDAMFHVHQAPHSRTLTITCKKMRDYDPIQPMYRQFMDVHVTLDDNEIATSCVLIPTDKADRQQTDRGDSGYTDLQLKMLACIAESEPSGMKTGDIVKQIFPDGHSPNLNSIQRALKKLKTKKLIEHTGQNRPYQITAVGREVLDHR